MNDYEDILNFPHHVSSRHPQMSRMNRAAQFLPFAALTGYDAAIRETARQTDRKIELDEAAQDELDAKLRLLKDAEAEHPAVALVVFAPDPRKSGGEYVSIEGKIRRIDAFARRVILTDGREIAIDNILEISGGAFDRRDVVP